MNSCGRIFNYQKSCYHSHLKLRESFYKYFESKNHEIIPSSSVIPPNDDATLLFTNAGMNQFKNTILNSNETKLVANIQKCIRAGGKHNDLDDVGKDLHHQTFFEMMGNWSFNDAASKIELCEIAWKFLCDELKIDSNRLYVSYFGGSTKLGLKEDHECKEIWRKIGIPDNRILPFVNENFWEMGKIGPCGRCTEIHYDRIGNRNASKLVNIDDSVIEIWNIVFMSHLRENSGKIKKLGKNHVDTGMGFERLLSILQGKQSNFDTDVFEAIMTKISQINKYNLKYSGSIDLSTKTGQQDAIFRVLADHIRTVSIAISDGALPNSTGNGFIVRKMLRRMFIQASDGLNIDRYAIVELVPVFVKIMGEVYPELLKNEQNIKKIIIEEEKQFWKTVDKAKYKFYEIAKETKGNTISGKNAFNLFDTYGLPLSITAELARSIGKTVNVQEFEKHQQEAQSLSKNASKCSLPITVYDYENQNDEHKYKMQFIDNNYEFPQISSEILDIFLENKKVEKLLGKGEIILKDCQFYAEQGGQASDFGVLKIENKIVFEVKNVKKSRDGKVSILYGEAVNEGIKKTDVVIQEIDKNRRRGLMRAHSATHLLHFAIKKTGLGNGQKGSSVESDRIRFDYSTNELKENENRLTKIEKIQEIIEEYLKSEEKSKVEVVTMNEALQYPNLQSEIKKEKINSKSVRIVQLKESVECCSGTHVENLSTISDFVILSDKSCAKSIRRIIAVTGEEAKNCKKYSEKIWKKLRKCEDLKERSNIGKSIDWKRIPLLDQEKMSKLVKNRKK